MNAIEHARLSVNEHIREICEIDVELDQLRFRRDEAGDEENTTFWQSRIQRLERKKVNQLSDLHRVWDWLYGLLSGDLVEA